MVTALSGLLAALGTGPPAPQVPDHSVIAALVASGSAILVALIGGAVTLMVQRRNTRANPLGEPSDPGDTRRVARELAFERMLLQLGFDPPLIVTGYEDPDDVRRHRDRPRPG